MNLVTKNGATISGVTATASNGNGTNAIDSNGGTRWEASANDPQWIKVDLGSVKTVKAIEAWWETASSKDYNVKVSTDDSTYKSVALVRGAASGANRRDTVVLTNAVNARYVMIYATSRTTNWGHSIFELAIYDGQEAPENYIDVTDYKATTPATAPTAPAGKIFAGWYEDADFTTTYTETTGYAYAKFIDEDVLTVMAQTKKEDGNDVAIRFVSTIDEGVDYQEIGFKFTGTYGESIISEKTKSCQYVYSKITAAGEDILPTSYSDDSAYFFTYVVKNLAKSSTWKVTPYFVTPDGTTVLGTENSFETTYGE